MIRRILIISYVVTLAVLLGSLCLGAETITRKPSYKGTRFNTPVPKSMHHVNEGGSDGAGLCVITSALVAGQYQGVPSLQAGKGSLLWRTAKARPGGYWPEKLADLIDEVMPGERYASITDNRARPKLLEKLSRQGYVISTQLNTGELYKMRPIHHYVNYVEWNPRYAAFRDNNDKPGVFRVITAEEAARRSVDGGQFWAFIWLRKHPTEAVPHVLLISITATVFVVLVRPKPANGLDAEPDGGVS